MNIYTYGADEIPFLQNSAVTVGTFDGVHCGHRGIIERMLAVARNNDARTVVVTFEPHPQIVLQRSGREPVELLTTIEERCTELEKIGVDTVVVIPFTKEFAATEPADFVSGIIVKTIGVRYFFIGHDHNFGKDRAGNEELLQEMGKEFGFEVEQLGPLSCNNRVVSSTKIRTALKHNEVVLASEMLGRSYAITGVVMRGDGRGKELGYPTANIKPLNPHKLMPGNGVYVVRCWVNATEYSGMANIGVRPTFTTDKVPTLEVHLLEADLDIYDREVTIEFLEFLRSEQRFESKEALLHQLERDKQQTQVFFQQFNHGEIHDH